MRAAAPVSPDRYLGILDRLRTEMIEQQHHKLLQLAWRIVPDITPEDLRNPQDFLLLS